MYTDKPYTLTINKTFNADDLCKNIHIAVLHATRIPPHIGLIINRHYHSLTIKGRDCNTPIAALLRNIQQREIAAVFIKINSHPVFSDFYMSEHFISNVGQFPRVDVGIATCLSPLKLFFEEVYHIPMQNVNFLYDLLPMLYSRNLITDITSLFINETVFQLPYYTSAEINKEIKEVRDNFNTI